MTTIWRHDGTRCEGAGLVTIWADGGMSLWRPVFERRAANTVAAVERRIAANVPKQGTWLSDFPDEVLAILRRAYEEAAAKARQVV